MNKARHGSLLETRIWEIARGFLAIIYWGSLGGGGGKEGGRDDRGLLSRAHRCKLQPLAGLLRPRPLSSGVAVARSACVR